jgi:phospho-N-acetylmuramoyl-pentapeptide-transferase
MKVVNVTFFTFISFGMLGLLDDIRKFFGVQKTHFFGLRMKQKLILQIILAIISSCLLYFSLGIDFVNVPYFGIIKLGLLFIPFATFIVVAFTNAVNITDGLDGLAGSVLLIALFGLWILSAQFVDTPIAIFLALWIGALIAFLYFNIFPARIMMGDVGALAFGATLAVIGLLLGKIVALLIIGGIYILELTSSFAQLISKKFWKRKIFPVAPIHLWLQHIGWEEPKIVQRAMLVSLLLTLFGLWLNYL